MLLILSSASCSVVFRQKQTAQRFGEQSQSVLNNERTCFFDCNVEEHSFSGKNFLGRYQLCNQVLYYEIARFSQYPKRFSKDRHRHNVRSK